MRSLASKLAVYFSIVALATPAAAQSFETWEAKAQKAHKAGDEQLAAEYWTDALRVWEAKDGRAKRANALSERAALYEKAGEPDGALADLTAALKLTPKKAPLYDRRGQIYLAQTKLAEAISDFYSATKLSITYGPAFYHRGLAYEQQGDAQFAKEDFRTACRLGVKDACARVKAAKKARAAAPAEAASGAAAEGTEEAAPSPAPAKKTQKKRPKKPKPVVKADMAACAAGIQACSDEGKAIDICVGEAPVCEKTGGKACCPELCVTQFKRASSPERSDAELFRMLFSEKSDCTRGATPDATPFLAPEGDAPPAQAPDEGAP